MSHTRDKLPVIELFGPTLQGEGVLIGQLSHFVRLAGCDSKCRQCDTKYAWGLKSSEIEWLLPKEILERVDALPRARLVTITGGNPALYDQPVTELIIGLHNLDYKVACETQGTISRQWFNLVDSLVISPKGPGMADTPTGISSVRKCIYDAQGPDDWPEISLKVVVFDREDLEYARSIRRYFPDCRLVLQAGTAPDEELPSGPLQRVNQMLQWIRGDPDFIDATLLPQLHTLIWQRRRGV